MRDVAHCLPIWRSVWLDRCEERAVRRVGLICLSGGSTGHTARGSWAGPHEAERKDSEQTPSGKCVGSWTRMRATCSITRAPILFRRSRIVANSLPASGWRPPAGRAAPLHDLDLLEHEVKPIERAQQPFWPSAPSIKPSSSKRRSSSTTGNPFTSSATQIA
jgi:hypothetical protein